MAGANPIRGEASLTIHGKRYVLRPSFTALVAAEEELGSLYALVERAGEGQLRLSELGALFWHCLACHPGTDGEAAPPLARAELERAVMAQGLVGCAPVLKQLLSQILGGSA